MQKTPSSGWIAGADAWLSFARKHPELGIKPTNHSAVHFFRTHAPKLIEADVLRQTAFRNRLIADEARFDAAVFNLLTTGKVEGRGAAGGHD